MEFINVVLYSIPMFIALIILEVLVDRFSKGGKYRLNDGISNLSAGLIHQTFGFLPKAIMAISYVWIYENMALFKDYISAKNPITWILLFLAVDFQYYWSHRFLIAWLSSGAVMWFITKVKSTT